MKVRKRFARLVARSPFARAYVDAFKALALRHRGWRAFGASSETPRYGVDLAGFLHGALGLGESARALARALEASDLPHGFVSIPLGPERDTQAPGVSTDSVLRFSHTVLHVNPSNVAAFLESLPPGALRGKKLIGLWYWELETVPLDWRAMSLVFDEVWVASEWNREHLSRQLLCPVHKLPFPIDALPMGRSGSPCPVGIPKDTFSFFYAFDFHSGFERKNPMATLDAYLKAFPTPTGTARLVLKSLNGRHAPLDLERLRAIIGDRPDIVLFDGDLSREQMDALFDGIDCFVSLHRSEGLGLGILEAVRRGKWVIMTDYAAPTEFRDLPGVVPIRCTLVPVATRTTVYDGLGRWADPDITEAAEKMRSLASGRARPRASEGAEAVLGGHSSSAFGRFVRARLTSLG